MKNKLQEKFDDFGSIPSTDVWAEIERQLNQKRKRRALIFWFSSGIAACLVGLILLINFNSQENLAKKTNVASSKKETNLSANPSNKTITDTLLVEKVEPIENTVLEVEKIQDKKLTKRKALRTDFNNRNQVDLSHKLTELSHQFDQKQEVSKKADSSSILVQTEVSKKDSLVEKDTIVSIENNLTNHQNLIKKDSVTKRKAWSIEFTLATWDAQNNRNQDMSSNSSSDSESNFWVPSVTTNYANSSSNNSLFTSVYKPITFNFGVNYRTNKNWIVSSGLNFDLTQGKSISNSSNSTSNLFSLGIPLGLGYIFRAEKQLQFVPKISNISNFMLFQRTKEVINPVSNADPLTSLNQTSKFSGYQNAFQFDFSFKYNLNSKNQFFISPVMTYYLFQKINTGSIQILKRDFWYGIKLGYQYNF